MTTKQCEACRLDKLPNEFYPAPAARDGLSRRCVSCCVIEASAERLRARVARLKGNAP
jgi:hypothetical protein